MNWQDIIEKEKEKSYYKKLSNKIDFEYKNKIIFPEKINIFKAFKLCEYENTKVVILGQDPYHTIGMADGMSFSTSAYVKNPPSIVNIFKTIKLDTSKESICKDGYLEPWAKQGVLLLNTILTVEQSLPNSHKNIGWEEFSDNIIKHISLNMNNIIFILWGSCAMSKQKNIDKTRHHILSAPHPSPLSAYRGFFECNHFSKANSILKLVDKKEIVW